MGAGEPAPDMPRVEATLTWLNTCAMDVVATALQRKGCWVKEAPKPTLEDDVCVRRTSTYLLVTLSYIQDVSGATRSSKCARWMVMSIAIGPEKMTR